jgi:hydrogenase maturation protein HypF
MRAEAIRVRGLVQGVGFRPTVWRIAHELGLSGDVRNDGDGVLIRLSGAEAQISGFCSELRSQCPPLARIDSLERSELNIAIGSGAFRIISSDAGGVHTGVVPDAATCADCVQEIFDPANRRYRYPFTNCTHCGPRLSIVRSIPYDRANTSMSVFNFCPDCQREYEDPADRRFHAQPNACPVCGPEVWLVDYEGKRVDPANLDLPDAVALASQLLEAGAIVAIKGVGGFHLACDASNDDAVEALRSRKRRYRKPFALMARDLDMISEYAVFDEHSEAQLISAAAPIVLLNKTEASTLAAGIAPGQNTLGFMLPYSPLHHLLLADWNRPLVMTSGNLSDEPQCFENNEAATRLSGLADYLLLHNREIVNRVDDSVVRVMDGEPRLLRRARGYAPAPINLPEGFEKVNGITALGAELKNTFCLLKDGQAILSQHLGDLEDARTTYEYERTLTLYQQLFDHSPEQLVADLHPDYRTTRIGKQMAGEHGIPLMQVQHHHAHLASVLADNGVSRNASPVLGIMLDGLGLGTDETIWGGEFLVGGYPECERVAHFRAVPLPGASRAILEPWRNFLAQIDTCFGIEDFLSEFPDLAITKFLKTQPLIDYQTMMERQINSPQTSSCGRLFDAVAAALGICTEGVSYEGEAAIELEACSSLGVDRGLAYSFAIKPGDVLQIDPEPMWRALLNDLKRGTAVSEIGARFHHGLVDVIVEAALRISNQRKIETMALSGGVFQNRYLLECVVSGLEEAGRQVLTHRQVPSNDGGISLGQALIAASRVKP